MFVGSRWQSGWCWGKASQSMNNNYRTTYSLRANKFTPWIILTEQGIKISVLYALFQKINCYRMMMFHKQDSAPLQVLLGSVCIVDQQQHTCTHWTCINDNCVNIQYIACYIILSPIIMISLRLIRCSGNVAHILLQWYWTICSTGVRNSWCWHNKRNSILMLMIWDATVCTTCF